MSDYGQGSYGQYHKPGSTQPYGYYHEGPRLPPSQDGYAPFPSQGLAGAQVGGPPSYHYSGPSRAYAPNHDAYGYNSSHVPEVRLPASMTPADAPPRYHESDGYPPRNSGPWMQQPPNDIYKRSTPYLPQENPRPPPQSHTASYHVEPFVPQPAYSGTFSSSRHHEERPEEPEIVLESVEKSTPKRMRDDLEEGELTESEEEPIRQQQTRSPPPSWPVQMVWEPQSERTRRNEYPADEARHQESRGHMPQLPSGIAPAGPTVYPQKIHSPHEETPSGRHNGQAVDESDFYSPHKPSLDFTPRKDIQPTARRHDKAPQSTKSADMAPATALNPLPESSHSLSQTTDMSFQPPTLSALAKAKKDAENALKDLWSLDIRDEQLVAEGFDSSFIKSLVADLGLNGPKSSGPPPEHKTEPSKEAPAAPSSSEALAERQPPAISKTVEPAAGKSSEKAPAASAETAKPDAGTASTEPVPEGRAVRIARRLAEKTQKLAAERAAREAAEKAAREEAAAKEAAEAARAAAVKAEKERRLQQKLAALQRSLKARELERQEAAKPVTPQPAAAPTTTPAVSNQPLTTTKPQQMSVPTNSTDSVASSTQPTRAAASIPGLFLSSNSKPGGTALQAPAPATQRKRPVAADFDDFVESVVPPKRPFGHDRNNTSLVIDVSDGSDSDVEMETESHEDVPAKAPQEPTPSLRRNLSFRDHPPLTDTNSFRKKYSTPPVSSAAHTPVNHVARKLPNLDQEIADLKKKIAEKEARRKNGALARATSNVADEEKAPTDATRSSSSQLASQLPSTSPEPSTVTKRPALPPRNRVTSERLMQVRSGLEEKTARLKALRDEIARLESEVEADRRQHDSLVRELEEAGGDGDDTAQPQAEHGDDGCHVLAKESATHEGTPVGPPEKDQSTPEARPEPMVDVVPSAARAPTDEQLPDAVGETSPNEARPTPAEGEPKDAVLTAVTQGNDNVPADHASLNEPPASMDTNMSDSGPGNVTEQPDEQQRRLFDEPPAPGDSAASGEESDVSASMSTDSSADSPDVHGSGVQGDGRESDGAAQPENVSVLPGAERSDGESERSQSMEMGSSQPSPGLPDEPTGAHGDDGVAATAGGSPHQSLDAAANMTLPQTAGRPARVEVETVPPAGPFTATNRMQKDSSDESRKGSTFTPYVSPLRYFRAYRFHPEFTANVPGGFRSATYSNNIDIRKEVCPEELAGRECSLGETCRYQHFSSMAVKDEKILLDLGDCTDRRSDFIDGLRKYLQQFRERDVRDFDTIAKGILDYRRKFYGDDSRILPLDGVTI